MLELRQGTQLADRYTLVSRLGGDGQTHTWQAKDRLTGALVALKISSGEPQRTASLRAEWQTSIRLMHAHIVRAFEFHAEPELAFFSQQYIDGPDLGALTGLPVSEVLGPVGLLAEALSYVHAKGIVHRDLKASNVLLDGNGALYLSDFGVSCGVGQRGSGGSPVAQSPQSLAGEPASPADDIFALGSLIYELLSGRPPWSSTDIAAQIKNQNPETPRAADGSALPQPIVTLLLQMLDKEPGNRPAAGEVVERLKAAGFAPCAATMRGGVKPQHGEAATESVQSIRHVSRAPGDVATDAEQGSSGLRRGAVVVAFGVLIAVLIAVLVVLPDRIAEQTGEEIAVERIEPESASLPDVAVVDEVVDDRTGIYVDAEVRRRIKGDTNLPTRKLDEDDDITFSENSADYSGLDEQGRARFSAESTLGELLSALEVLEARGVERWAAREYRNARDLYADGDAAYLKKDFEYAEELYLGSLTVLEPLYKRIEPSFKKAYAGATAAFETGDRLEALRQFELAVAITPTHADAQAGYQRAKNLETVLRLVDQGLEYEKDLELEAAQRSFEKAAALDGLWEPAQAGVVRIQQIRTKLEFDTRMTEGIEQLAAGDYLSARAAFRVAQRLIPGSSEPQDGLLQVDQGLRLQQISTLEQEAQSLQRDEHWDAVVKTYEEILKVDSTLTFASEGLSYGREMSALHTRLDKLIAEPDSLSVPSVMQKATMLVVDVTTRSDVGPRLGGQRDELSRLLKRAATPLAVQLVSDNLTEVSIYKIGRLGSFMRKELNLRPGSYVAVGSRPGFRDVRVEFRVAPEIESEPVIIQCEERI